MTDTDNSIDSHLNQLIDVSDAISRAQALLDAVSLILEDIGLPADLVRTVNALQTTLNAADAELHFGRETVDALCDKCRSPKDKAERRSTPASAQH